MKHTTSKFFQALCGIDTILIMCMGIVVMFVLVTDITSVPALAASNGIYIATATPHYKHPTTGKIEDAGGDGSSVLGQSMTESATYRKALVEVDAKGNTYITVRLQLMDNIQNPQFQVDGKAVSASLMQEDYTNNTADYRIMVNSENSIIRCNMYVIAMGRDVIFYITVSNLQSGCGDFITSVKVEEVKSSDATETQTPAASQDDSQTSAQTESPTTDTPEQTDFSQTSPSVTESTNPSEFETKTSVDFEPETSKKNEETILGLQEFDKNGNNIEYNSNNTKNTTQKSDSSSIVWWGFGSFIVIAVAGGVIWYFCFFKKR